MSAVERASVQNIVVLLLNAEDLSLNYFTSAGNISHAEVVGIDKTPNLVTRLTYYIVVLGKVRRTL